MKMRRSAASLLAIGTLLGGCATAALAQRIEPGGHTSVTIPASSVARPGDAGVRAHTNIRLLSFPGEFSEAPQTAGPPYSGYFYEDPASLACIYNLVTPVGGCNENVVTQNPLGGSRAIAVVDAYDDPNAFTDLQSFSTQFGVAAINPHSFKVVYAPLGGNTVGSCTGPASEPPVDPSGGWEIEESLDIEYSHSMAPWAKLYLVEAQSESYADLLCAETVASKLVAREGGGEVSNSWGGGEFSAESSLDSVFTTRGVVYFASAGDSPGPIYPSVSPNVVSVGGTTLSTNPYTGSFELENTWQDGGGGPSAYEFRPAYQDGIQNWVGSQRGTPDISAVANPNTGVWVLDNFLIPENNGETYCDGTPCWLIVGGTSVASPLVAGIVNAAGSFAASSNDELTRLYKDKSADFNDITYGNCGPYIGYFAAPGWDFCSGLGSPSTYRGK
jgi:subtilase family serine protease